MKFHELCGNEHAKRAAEVALAGDHTIAFIGSPDGDAWMFAHVTDGAYTELVEEWHSIATQWVPCYCGEAHLLGGNCLCGESIVWEWQQEHPRPNADIYVTVLRPHTDKLMVWANAGYSYGELHEQIMHRVECTRMRGMEGPHEFADVAWALLRSATHQLILESAGVRSTVEVAQTIARLAGANQVEAQHMAEAIQYRLRSTQFDPPPTDEEM